jgi:hypothetical protein
MIHTSIVNANNYILLKCLSLSTDLCYILSVYRNELSSKRFTERTFYICIIEKKIN